MKLTESKKAKLFIAWHKAKYLENFGSISHCLNDANICIRDNNSIYQAFCGGLEMAPEIKLPKTPNSVQDAGDMGYILAVKDMKKINGIVEPGEKVKKKKPIMVTCPECQGEGSLGTPGKFSFCTCYICKGKGEIENGMYGYLCDEAARC